jgi:single-stranded-DNA-specific exonuclease
MSKIIEQLRRARGLQSAADLDSFVSPDYDKNVHDPFLLPDMALAVERLVKAKQKDEFIYIYGDYDIDGLTATTLLLSSFESFGFRCKAFIPNRFVDGYGLSDSAIRQIAANGAQLVVTVDCGSLSHNEISLANELGMDVIVTDHHSVADIMPPAVAVINPKRSDHKYPFIDLAGVGVAFKLVQAMQTKLGGLPLGQEKWLLDLVAFGTVCDVVQLKGENRALVYWGLKVMAKTKRVGLKALAQVVGLSMDKIIARNLGFVFGPHLNASGRLETAELSLELLTVKEPLRAVEIAYKLRDMNIARRAEQNRITKAALAQAELFRDDPVLVLSGADWSHGIIGIVAAKVMESLHKPTYVLQEIGEESKGSARSFGDFSAVAAIRAADEWLTRGGGHKLAAGVTLNTKNIAAFRASVNEFYRGQKLENQARFFEPTADAMVDDLSEINQELIDFMSQLEPFGHGNPEPILCLSRAVVHRSQALGKDDDHLKLEVGDKLGGRLQMIGFGMAKKNAIDIGDEVTAWFKLIENEWNSRVTLQGQIVKIQPFVGSE